MATNDSTPRIFRAKLIGWPAHQPAVAFAIIAALILTTIGLGLALSYKAGRRVDGVEMIGVFSGKVNHVDGALSGGPVNGVCIIRADTRMQECGTAFLHGRTAPKQGDQIRVMAFWAPIGPNIRQEAFTVLSSL